MRMFKMDEIKIIEFIKAYGDVNAIVHMDRTYTYSDLIEKIEYWDEKLAGIPASSVIGIESDFSLDSIALIFSLIRKPAIIVPLDQKQKDKNSEKYSIAELNYLVEITLQAISVSLK
jgi:hypothetical protein